MSVFNVFYSTLLHLPPLRFHCVGGCWYRTQDCCDFGICSNQLIHWLDLIHKQDLVYSRMSVTLPPFLYPLPFTCPPSLCLTLFPEPFPYSPCRLAKNKRRGNIICWQCRTVQEYLKGIIKKFDYNVTCEHIYTSIASGKRRKASPLKVNSNIHWLGWCFNVETLFQ